MLDERIKKLEQEKQEALLKLNQFDLKPEERTSAIRVIDETHEGLIMHLRNLYKKGFEIASDFKEDRAIYEQNEKYRFFITHICAHRARIVGLVKVLEEGGTVVDYFNCR